jgi:cation diffusion facilitator family transporter
MWLSVPESWTWMSADPGSTLAELQRTQRLRGVRQTLLIVLGLNLAVAFAKLGYGLWSGSVAMSADGVQSLLDGLSNVVGLISIAIAARPPDEEHHFGHERYETLASLLIAGMMSVSVIQILQEAIGQLRNDSTPTVNVGSFGVLFATMTVNVGVFWWEQRQGRKYKSDLLLADARHTLSDVFVSLSVIAGLLAVKAGWDKADAVVSIAITVVISWAAWTIVRDASLVLTDATDVDPRELMAAILATDGVITAHKLRARTTGGRLLAQVDITVDPILRISQAHEIASRVEGAIKDVAGAESQVVVHIEPAVEPHTRPDALFGDVQLRRTQQHIPTQE